MDSGFFFFYSLNQTQILPLLLQVLTHLELDTDKCTMLRKSLPRFPVWGELFAMYISGGGGYGG